MTEAQVRGRILIFANGSEDPVLASEDLDVLVAMCRTVDTSGIVPGDTNWVETYNVNYGISQAWLLKAGRLSGKYLFMSGGKMLARQQMYDHCMNQYRTYSMRSGIRAQRLGPVVDPIYAPNNWNP